jgi:hypothetical protein
MGERSQGTTLSSRSAEHRLDSWKDARLSVSLLPNTDGTDGI